MNSKERKYFIVVLCGIIFAVFILKLAFLADIPVRAAVLRMQGTAWDHSLAKVIISAISRYGDWPELMVLGCIGFFIARQRNNKKWQQIFLIAMLASTLAGALTNTLRLTTGRTRPRVSPQREQAWYGPYHEGKWTIGSSELNSFPSGHTATAVAFAIVIFLGSSFWGSMALCGAIMIASSRLLLGAHHPSDLLAATILSVFIALILWSYFLRHPYALKKFILIKNKK